MDGVLGFEVSYRAIVLAKRFFILDQAQPDPSPTYLKLVRHVFFSFRNDWMEMSTGKRPRLGTPQDLKFVSFVILICLLKLAKMWP